MERKIKMRYALAGAVFGLMFPLGAIPMEILLSGLPFTFDAIPLAHMNNKLLFMIDSAPIFLGLFAYMGGLNQAKAIALLENNEQLLQDSTGAKQRLEAVSKTQTELLVVLAEQSELLLKGFEETRKEMQGIIDLDDHIRDRNTDIIQIMEMLDGQVAHSNEYASSVNDEMTHLLTQLQSTIQTNTEHQPVYQCLAMGLGESVQTSNLLIQTSDRISEELKKISSISAQINMLALNASIEAARAGETGQGFAVVADEVGKLSVQTAHSLDQVIGVQHSLIQQVDALKKDMQQLEDTVGQITGVSGDTAASLQELIGHLGNVSTHMSHMVDHNSAQTRSYSTVKSNTLAVYKDTEQLSGRIETYYNQLEKQENAVKKLHQTSTRS